MILQNLFDSWAIELFLRATSLDVMLCIKLFNFLREKFFQFPHCIIPRPHHPAMELGLGIQLHDSHIFLPRMYVNWRELFTLWVDNVILRIILNIFNCPRDAFDKSPLLVGFV